MIDTAFTNNRIEYENGFGNEYGHGDGGEDGHDNETGYGDGYENDIL